MTMFQPIPNGMTQDKFLGAIANRPKRILSSNSKLKKDGIWNITLPAYKGIVTMNGEVKEVTTCPGAGACLKICYAGQGCFNFSNCKIKHASNLQYMISDPFGFANQLIDEINDLKSKGKLRFVRWHDAGDFTDIGWTVAKFVMQAMPEIKFYAYTKNIPLFRAAESRNEIPSNFTYIFSYGGKFDHMINKDTDRIAMAFNTRRELRAAKFTEGFNSDIPATNRKNKRIGLIIHGNWKAIGNLKKANAGIMNRSLAS